MTTLITGSMAYDTIMVFEDHFKNHILPDQIHILNVSFFTPKMYKHFGGCAGNIAYTLKLLGGEPAIMATVGSDFSPYANWLDEHEISRQHIKELGDQFTAQAYLTTDLDNNQITAFHPGAMNDAHVNKISDAEGIKLGIVAPNGKQAMVDHAADFATAGIPFIFDPGQGLPMFDGDELLNFCQQAEYAVMNDYESRLMMDKTGLDKAALAESFSVLIITKGSHGSELHINGEVVDIASAPVAQAVDPTGCGDAYRGGLLYAIDQGLDWRIAGQIAALCGAIKIEQSGTQNHHFTMDAFEQRYQQAFGEAMPG